MIPIATQYPFKHACDNILTTLILTHLLFFQCDKDVLFIYLLMRISSFNNTTTYLEIFCVFQKFGESLPCNDTIIP